MNVIATAKIIAASTRFLDRPPVVLVIVIFSPWLDEGDSFGRTTNPVDQRDSGEVFHCAEECVNPPFVVCWRASRSSPVASVVE
jgi:hypothetical protein